ncbi:MAG: DUF1134 domain-containing protein [Caulobacterales bacterium]|jgi:hypothetical protein
MANDRNATRRDIAMGLVSAGLLALPSPARAQNGGSGSEAYTLEEIRNAASSFFGAGAGGLASVLERVFSENGNPVGYIEGGEASGAIGVGLRYGDGQLHFHRRRETTKVYWQGPSIGWDTGGNASKVFTLIYGMTNPLQIFRRFPGVEGTAYFVGGLGVNYQRAEGITLAPIRFGVGLRAGANIGYLAYSPRRNILPF